MYSIRLDGDTKKLMQRIKHFSDMDKKDLNAALGEVVRESTVTRFRTGKGPDGKLWKTSARAALEGGKTLVQSARLKNSIHAKSDASGFAVGTNVIYAATHQMGAKNRTIRAKTSKGLRFKVGGSWITTQKVRVNIPARPFLGISEEDRTEIKRTLEDALGE